MLDAMVSISWKLQKKVIQRLLCGIGTIHAMKKMIFKEKTVYCSGLLKQNIIQYFVLIMIFQWF